MPRLILVLYFFLTSAFLSAQATTIYAKAYGSNANPPIIFIHGGPRGNATLFEGTTAQELANQGFYVLVYDRFCQMLLSEGKFNGKQILKAETIAKMTQVNQLPEFNAGGKGFKFGLGFQLYNDQRKPTPKLSNSAYAWGGYYGTEYIVDPENNLIGLFYINMPKYEALLPGFLKKAYELFKL